MISRHRRGNNAAVLCGSLVLCRRTLYFAAKNRQRVEETGRRSRAARVSRIAAG